MARNYAVLPHEYIEEFAELNDAEIGRLVMALLRFSVTGEEQVLTGNERFLMRRVYAQERRFQEHYENLSHNRSEAGKKGAAKRWNGNAMANDGKDGNTEPKPETKYEPKPNTEYETKYEPKPETKPKYEPEYKPQPKYNPVPGGVGEGMSEGFLAFWNAYPVSGGGQEATWQVWRSCVREEWVPRILTALERFRASPRWRGDGGKYIPAPARFLRERMWEKPPMPQGAVASCTLGDAELAAIRRVLETGE